MFHFASHGTLPCKSGALLLCLFGCLFGCLPGQAWAGGDRNGGRPYIAVFAEPQLRGDVHFLLSATGFVQPPDLNAIVRQSLGCDWRPAVENERATQGTCRRLLRADQGAVAGTLRLQPLSAALRAAGAAEVRVTLAAAGAPEASAGPHWVAGPLAKVTSTGKLIDVRTWQFRAAGGAAGPPPFAVRLGKPWSPRHLGVPLLTVLCGPGVLALWFRKRTRRAGTDPATGSIWINRILLGTWLYWISTVGIENLAGLGAFLDTDQWLLPLLLGAFLFSAPPLIAVVICLVALSPRAGSGTQEPGRLPRSVRLGVAKQALFPVPLGLLLMGTALLAQEFRIGLFSLLAAYAAYRALSWWVWRWSAEGIQVVERGGLRARAGALAQAAGAQLNVLQITGSRAAALGANAFASAGGTLSLTRALLENLTVREVDAVIAHEVGHLRGKRVGSRVVVLLVYLFVIGPGVSRLVAAAGLPHWVLLLPVSPLLCVLAASWLSQKHEDSTDARAAQLTNDPEGLIAALGRLGRLTRSPIDWGGMQGSMLAHPSIGRRARAIARRFGVPESRALELLEDRAAATTCRYPLPEEVPPGETGFSYVAARSQTYWRNWVTGGALAGLLLVWEMAAASAGLPGRWPLLAFLAAIPAAGWLTLVLEDWQDRSAHQFATGAPPRKGRSTAAWSSVKTAAMIFAGTFALRAALEGYAGMATVPAVAALIYLATTALRLSRQPVAAAAAMRPAATVDVPCESAGC
jgi:Zn-dependent protease with chaperone function